MDSRYATAPTGGVAGAQNTFLLHQELRRREQLAASGSFAPAPAPAEHAAAACGADEMARLHAVRDRLLEAERADPFRRGATAFDVEALERLVALQPPAPDARDREMERRAQAELDWAGQAGGSVLRGPPPASRGAFGPPPVAAGGDRFAGAAAHSHGAPGGVVGLPPAADGGDRFAGAAAHGGGGAVPDAAALPGQLTEEMAVREILQRRLLEHHRQQEQAALHGQRFQQEQAAALHGQRQAALNRQQAMASLAAGRGEAQAADAVDREQLGRLLRLKHLQHLQDLDLIRRTAEAQNAQSAALQESMERHQRAALDQRLLEAHLLREGLQRFQGSQRNDDPRSGLHAMDSARADAATSRVFSGGTEEPPGKIASPTQETHLSHGARPPGWFNGDMGVNVTGGTLPPDGSRPSTAPSQGLASHAPALPGVSHLDSLDDNVVANFLTVIVSEVPEIAPIIVDLLPQGGDTARLKREFPAVVAAALARLKAIHRRIATATDDGSRDLLRRVTMCIVAIEPHGGERGAEGGGVLAPGRTAEMLAPGLPPTNMDDNSCHPPMPNSKMTHLAVPGGDPRPGYLRGPEDLDMAQSAGAFQHGAVENQFTSPVTKQAGAVPPCEDVPSRHPLMPNNKMNHPAMPGGVPRPGYLCGPEAFDIAQQAGALQHSAVENETPRVTKEAGTQPETSCQDMPMMPAHESNKKAVKEALKRKKAMSKINRKPRVVHRALSKNTSDEAVSAKSTAASIKEERTNSASSSHTHSPTESFKLPAEANERPMPLKKRRISANQGSGASNNKSTPMSSGPRKKDQGKNKGPPKSNGELLLMRPLSAANATFPSAGVVDESVAEHSRVGRKRSAKSSKVVSQGSSSGSALPLSGPNDANSTASSAAAERLLVGETGQRVARRGASASNENEGYSQLDAASVLLDLMRK